MKEYTDEILNKIKKLELGILEEFDNICMNEGFEYCLCVGSCLGAVRHGGFIPWDDDIDVCMPRKDYDRFLNYAKEHLANRYNIINVNEYKNYPLSTTQLALKGTTFVVEPFKDLTDIPFGIFLDIFPMDYVDDDDKKMNRQILKTYILGKFMILASVKKPYLPFKGIKRSIVYFGTTCVHYMLKLFGVSAQSISRKMRKIVECNKDGAQRIHFMHSSTFKRGLSKRSDYFPANRGKFCELTVCLPKEIDITLKAAFDGDYMQLPPVEKRKTHCPYKLDFGDY